jgi:glucokinase
MYLGIEIGGTKLQLGVGDGSGGELAELVRHDVDASRGAAGILEQIDRSAAALVPKHSIERIGIGFGGPVNAAAGIATKSHQVAGWDSFPLARWCRETLGREATIGNDCDVASLAEARYGAGRGSASVFYVTVGTGIGGGLVLGGRLHGGGRPAAAEIGHLRPGLAADKPDMTVESLASGPAIAAAAIARITGQVSRPLESIRPGETQPTRQQARQRLADVHDAEQEDIDDLLNRADGDVERVTA